MSKRQLHRSSQFLTHGRPCQKHRSSCCLKHRITFSQFLDAKFEPAARGGANLLPKVHAGTRAAGRFPTVCSGGRAQRAPDDDAVRPAGRPAVAMARRTTGRLRAVPLIICRSRPAPICPDRQSDHAAGTALVPPGAWESTRHALPSDRIPLARAMSAPEPRAVEAMYPSTILGPMTGTVRTIPPKRLTPSPEPDLVADVVEPVDPFIRVIAFAHNAQVLDSEPTGESIQIAAAACSAKTPIVVLFGVIELVL